MALLATYGFKGEDLTGRRFGRLTVIGPKKRDSRGHMVWACLCDCGRTTFSKSINLRRSRQERSCGCVRPGPKCNVEGQVFGYLTAIRPTEERSRHGGVIWIIRCRCGKEIKMDVAALKRKPKRLNQAPRSCGCYRKRNRSPKYKGVGDLSSTKFRSIMAKAKQRKIPFDITINYAWDLFLAQGKHCALTGVEIALSPNTRNPSTASLDRIDSTEGYVRGNIQWVHVEINYMKHSLQEENFIKWCRLVVSYLNRLNLVGEN